MTQMGEYEKTPSDRLARRTTQDDLTPAQRQAESFIYSALGVVLSGVPFLGAAYNELRTYRSEQFMKNRLSYMNHELISRMEGVEEEAVNREYLGSEAFFDLIGKAVETALRTRDREKIAYIASILKGAVINSNQEKHLTEELAEEYLYLVSDLTPQELRVARTLYNHQKRQESSIDEDRILEDWGLQRDKLSREHSIDRSDLSLILNRLAATGVADTVLINVPGTVQPVYQVSATFNKLMKFLESET
jgi:hypothetical protein